ncbi:MAG: 2-oxoglutarate dehydrogenase E1 component [Calditrichaeota bacterium]|nr:2-oxoglutarate dehydrogenase E1 component [Calditrichota bacterium]
MLHADARYIEDLYRNYQENPESVDYGWRKFFEGFEFGMESPAKAIAPPEHILKEIKVLNLIHAYRTRGHLFTKTNPVRTRRQYTPTLDIENFGLSVSDLETTFHAGTEVGLGPATLRKILQRLDKTYCSSVGVEYMYIREPEKVEWLKQRMETRENTPRFSLEQKRQILRKLSQAVLFEQFLHSKYVGQKRFSLQGGETLIPALDAAIKKGVELGISEFVMGMPHRGRLNVLANILNKSYEDIFSEFEDRGHAESVFAGDVKYHLGFTSQFVARDGRTVLLSLAPNPSHLEAVDPVVEGMARAKIDTKYAGDHKKVAPILIHGDASLAGQGVVYEVAQMSRLPAYETGGTIHLVVNNQIGFTTNYLDARSSTYSTDVAKVILSPVFHVNADDVEAVVYTVLLALEYRQTFHTDIFIDLLGYRKYGHNEGDEPRYTQPKLYKIIAGHPNPREIYKQRLLEGGELEQSVVQEMEKEFRNDLQMRFKKVREEEKIERASGFQDTCDQSVRIDFDFEAPLKTAVSKTRLLNLSKKIFHLSPNLHVFKKIDSLYQKRLERVLQQQEADWAIGEFLAYASLLDEGISIRLSGQDTKRGTFSHRHAAVYDEKTEEEYIPLRAAEKKGARFRIYNSLLSEYAALGFEYGYSCVVPKDLTVWEAQFGDFANGAQIIIDQFLSSSEAKWNRMSGLVLYLPHGYEGQGPEHSSARIERFLELCAKNNMIVANCTTPANLFHLLRRHLKMPFPQPLVLFTPKSLLRHPRCVSPLEEFSIGGFRPILDDPATEPQKIKKVLLSSGKIFYELLEKKEKEERNDVALVRLEQLYPFPRRGFEKIREKYSRAKLVWVQEEPENMGPRRYLMDILRDIPMEFLAREESATPATGFYQQFLIEQKTLLEQAFSGK